MQILFTNSVDRERSLCGDFLQATIPHLAGEYPLLIGTVSSGTKPTNRAVGQVKPFLVLRVTSQLKDKGIVGKSEGHGGNEEKLGCMREPESEENSKSWGKDQMAGRGTNPLWQPEKRIHFKVIYIPCEWTKRVTFTVKSTLTFWEWTAHPSRFKRQEEHSLSFLAKLNRFGCPFHGWKGSSNTHRHRHVQPPDYLTTNSDRFYPQP